jgi:hypothetical protein
MFMNMPGVPALADGASMTELVLHQNVVLVMMLDTLVGVLLTTNGLFVLCMSSIPSDQALLRRIFGTAALAAQLGFFGWGLFKDSDSDESPWKKKAVREIAHSLGWLMAMYFA